MVGKIYYIRLGTDELPWKDFGEVFENQGKEGIIKAMQSMKQFSTVEMTVYPNKKKTFKLQ